MSRRTSKSEQLDLGGRGFEDRSLFSENFLERRLPEWEDFQRIDVEPALGALAEIWDRERDTIASANESQTEERLIKPILGVLGFEVSVQVDVRIKSGRRIPDYALFTSVEDRQSSERATGADRFAQSVALTEAKAFGVSLDKRGAGGAPLEDPEAQVLDYMWRTRVRWAILTNGREWRLYGQAGDLVEAAHLRIPDLPALISAGERSELRYFLAFFSAKSFVPDATGISFLDRAFAENEANARRIGESLRDQIFGAVPKIATGLLGDDPRDEQSLEDAFANSLVVLYRLLFCLYAESRNLLPVNNPAYAEYGLRKHRDEITSPQSTGSMKSDRLYYDLEVLFNLVDEGDTELGVNQYNGGLFSEDEHPWLAGRKVPDPLMREALVNLYEIDGESIDYRDLSIRHLGTMYEQLLEYRLADVDGEIQLVRAGGRHSSGSYFTPEPIVDAIVERTLDPLLIRKSEMLLENGTTGKEAVEELLDVSICDPAMGSGHFLVSAATYISRFIATDPSQEGEDINEVVLRRLVTERCLYGVDLNPMAVELARLALWLTSVDGERPLTFLENLRVGNSLVGADIDDLRRDITYAEQLADGVARMIDADSEIRSQPSENAEQVHHKQVLAETASRFREDLEKYANETIGPYFKGGVEHIFNWEIEFPEIFLERDGSVRANAGFDAVIGNPPYVRIQGIDRALADFIRKRYDAAHGSFDLYQVFIERAFGLLGRDGRLGFIVPNKFLKLESAEKLRARLADTELVESVADFGDQQIFDAATNYTCILILSCEGAPSVEYQRVPDHGRLPVSADIDRSPIEEFPASDLGGEPWILVPPGERSVIGDAMRGAQTLDSVTSSIFTGLQTSADKVYILENLGLTSAGRCVYSRSLDAELMLEPDLLHPLASGAEIDRWAICPPTNLLLFPYRRDGGKMRLLTHEELEALPLTLEYLRSNEAMLRAREGGKMDHHGWYAFGRHQGLELNDEPKLGVPRLCDRLHAAIDPDGEVYLDNVDVNGIIPSDDGVSIWVLAALMQSRLLDFLFKRGSVPFRGAFYSANKQFISWLPIRIPSNGAEGQLEGLARRLHDASRGRDLERGQFHDWLESLIGVPLSSLSGHTALSRYDELGREGALGVLRKNRKRVGVDTESRSFLETFTREYGRSVEQIAAHHREIRECEPLVDEAVYDLYEMTAEQRALVDREYEQ